MRTGTRVETLQQPTGAIVAVKKLKPRDFKRCRFWPAKMIVMMMMSGYRGNMIVFDREDDRTDEDDQFFICLYVCIKQV